VKHPPYPLRPNKAVDRYMLIEALKLLARPEDLKGYTYYGFGGPYLEDLRLLHEHFPKIKMVSFEANAQTHKRQFFHAPCSGIRLLRTDFRSFLAQNTFEKSASIFWLDYIDLHYGAFEEFKEVLEKVLPGSVVKVTVRAEPKDYDGVSDDGKSKVEEFKMRFGAVLPSASTAPPMRFEEFVQLLQQMFQIASQQALPSASGQTFLPIYSSCYSDGTGMFSICGIVCSRDALQENRVKFEDHRIANLDWGKPTRLNVPFLSTKERLLLQEYLPCPKNAGATLLKALGYFIDDGRKNSERTLQDYANFYRYYPHFIKARPRPEGCGNCRSLWLVC
jgi:hypothetical protein